MNATILHLLTLGRGDIARFCDDVAPSELQNMEREASSAAQNAAWISAYIGMRGANGYGDSGHERASAEANKQLKTVRKAMGYSYP
jgi:hypothetical protein